MENQKFLILRLSAVGDVVRTLPVVKALKQHYPASYVAWVTEEPSEALLESQPEIDQVILFPRRRWEKKLRSLTGLFVLAGELWRFVGNLRRHEFDVALDFHGILKSGLLSFFSGSRKRVGYDRRSTKEANSLFSNVKVNLPRKRINRFERNVALLRGIGIEVNGTNPGLHIPEKDREYVDFFFNSLGVSLRRPWIAIHPGTNAQAVFKRWTADRYARFADQLVTQLKATVILTWGPEELESVESIRKEMKEPSVLGPRTETLTQLGEVLKRCDLYVGGDTGPMHIASLVGTPVVVIFGPTDPIENEPLGLHKMVRKEVGCNPCRNRSCTERTCLKAITVSDVLEATHEVLSVKGGRCEYRS